MSQEGLPAPEIRRIRSGDATKKFRSGKHQLDYFLRKHAYNNDEAGHGATFVLARGEEILGFYTLCMSSVESEHVSSLLRVDLPRYPTPVALVARLAVSKDVQGQRFGERLLVDALEKSRSLSDTIGCFGVVVDAKDEDAEGFYSKYGFRCLVASEYPRRMFIALQTVRESFGL